MKKTKTQAFANLIGSLIFIALGVWALIQTYSFQEVKNTYVQAAVFPQIMCVGMLIFAIILLIQSIIKLMTMDENDPLAEPVLGHRLVLRPEYEIEGVTIGETVERIVAAVPVPR